MKRFFERLSRYRGVVFAALLVALFVDCDGDGLWNVSELAISGTAVLGADTDGDGMLDGYEVRNDLAPHDPADATVDADSDGLTHLEEFLADTDPHEADTDGDRLRDDAEIEQHGTDPRLADSDGDGLADGEEVLELATSPTQADQDQDGLRDGDEIERHGTDPRSLDSDRDLLSDGFEVAGGLAPTEKTDAGADPDGDGLTHLEEQIYGTRPLEADSDGDGATDGAEVASGGAPTSAADKGAPPEEAEVIRLTLTIGDHSGSESERYHLNVGRYSHQAMEFGVVETREYVFRRGMSYPITVVHAGTNREQPDYDYTAAITGSDPSVFTIEDPGGILGRHEESSPFFAAGKTATLTVHGETAVR